MKIFTSNLIGFIGKLPTSKLLNGNKRQPLESEVVASNLNEPHVRNWGKTANFLPEIGECHLSTALYQLELERARASAVA